jgi:hypothetical protein
VVGVRSAAAGAVLAVEVVAWEGTVAMGFVTMLDEGFENAQSWRAIEAGRARRMSSRT